MTTKCAMCGKEMKYDGFFAPINCDDCTLKWFKSMKGDLDKCNSKSNIGLFNQGWICPKCGAVMSPFEKHCINCKGDFNTYTPTWI